MDLSTWLNFISPGGPCFDLATLPIPGSPVSLAMIDALVEAHVKPRGDEVTVLEIGSFCGISTLTWGYALERLGISNYTIYCVDIWYHGGEVKYSPEKLEVKRGRNSFNHDIFKFNIAQSIGLSHVVEIVGDSRVALARLRDRFFDVIYVDGYHGYDAIASDIANAFRACRPGGIICGDDYDCSPEMMQSIPDDARQLDEYKMPSTDIGVHPGVVLAVDGLLGVPQSYGSFWAFEKVTDKAGPPFTDCVVALDVPALPRRIPKFIPPHVRPRFEQHFAGPAGFLPWHPYVAGMAGAGNPEGRGAEDLAAAHERELRRRDAEIDRLASELTRRSDEIARLESAVRELHESTSWKITAPMRRLKNAALRLGSGPGRAFVAPAELRPPTRPIDEDVALISRSGLFDAQHYAAQTADPIVHYLARGAIQGLDPHPLFDSSFYRERNPDVPADVNPLVHYLRHGAAEGRDPHPLFETAFYLEQKPHVAALGVNPLAHFVSEGPTAEFDPLSSPRPLPETDVCIVTPDIVGPIKNGGIGTACYHFARLLVEAGRAVTVVNTIDLSPCRQAHWKNTYARMGIKFLALSEMPDVAHPVHGSNWFLDRSWRVFKYLEQRILLGRPFSGLAREWVLVDQGETPGPRVRQDHADRHDALRHEVARRRDGAVRPRTDRDREAGLGRGVRDRALRRGPEPHRLHARVAVAERCPHSSVGVRDTQSLHGEHGAGGRVTGGRQRPPGVLRPPAARGRACTFSATRFASSSARAALSRTRCRFSERTSM